MFVKLSSLSFVMLCAALSGCGAGTEAAHPETVQMSSQSQYINENAAVAAGAAPARSAAPAAAIAATPVTEAPPSPAQREQDALSTVDFEQSFSMEMQRRHQEQAASALEQQIARGIPMPACAASGPDHCASTPDH